MTGKCRACGAVARLGSDGVCAWTGGCEHRQMQAAEAEARIDASLERLDGLAGGREQLRQAMLGAVQHPYDADLATYYERCVEALGAPVCVHCAAKAN